MFNRSLFSAVNILSRSKLLKLRDCNMVQVATVDLPVNPTGSGYNNVIGIHEYHKQFYHVGGITVPKRIICVGTDGVKRTQLLKVQSGRGLYSLIILP